MGEYMESFLHNVAGRTQSLQVQVHLAAIFR
jgi:hypothetical protein